MPINSADGTDMRQLIQWKTTLDMPQKRRKQKQKQKQKNNKNNNNMSTTKPENKVEESAG